MAAPLALDGDRVVELMVKEGDRVKKDQIITRAIDGRNQATNDRLARQARTVLNWTGETGETQVAEARTTFNTKRIKEL